MRKSILRVVAIALFALASTPIFAQQDSMLSGLKMLDYTTPKKYIIKDIKVHGVKNLDPDIISSTSGLAKGDVIDIPGDQLTSAMNKLWSQRYYSDVQILTDIVGDSVNLDIMLQERPRVYGWTFDGPSKSETTDLLDNLKLKKGSELSDFVINSSKEAIRKYYVEKGFYNNEVDVRVEDDSIRKNAVNVTFIVKKNSRVRIGDVTFEGNTAIIDKFLRGSLKKTKRKSINIFQSSKFKAKEYEADKDNLIDYYNSKGYRNASVVSDSIYKINDKRIGISITVDEGSKFYIRDIDWVGNSIYETDVLKQLLSINKGETYDKKTLHKRLGIGKEGNPDAISVSTLYQNEGYLFSQVEAAETIVGNDSIDITVKIFEGKPAIINDISFSGNMQVNDNIIRRELYLRPGELYDQSMLVQTIRQLGQMGNFDPETIAPGIVPISNDLVNISFPLTEKATDKLEVSGGWGAGMFVGSIGVQLNNVSLRRFFKKDAWKPYPSGQNQQLAIRGQTNGTYYKALSLNFTEPWLGGKKPNSLSVGVYYSDESNAYWIGQKSTQHFRTIGATFGIGRRLTWPDRNFTLYNEIGYQSYNLKDWTAFLMENGTANILTLKTVFGRSTLDQPFYPRTGSDFSIAVTLTPPYSLFDNKDYKSDKLTEQERYKWIEFHKWRLKADWYYPLSTNRNLVLRVKAEMGYLGSYNKNKPSPFEGFDVGGDGMSGYNVYGVDIIGLRGYPNGSLTPTNGTINRYATAFNKYTMELRYPIILKPSSSVYGLVFAEGGNAFSSWQDFDPFMIKRSLGAGVRLYLPIVGMIGIDWGYGFDRAVGKNKPHGGQIHFSMGMQF